MTLVGRTSAFFLGVLAVALLSFTLALYLLARGYLYDQANERLQSAVVALTAALEIKPEGLEWESSERDLNIGVNGGLEQIRWMIVDGTGKTIAQSENLNGEEFAPLTQSMSVAGAKTAPNATDRSDVTLAGHPWRVVSRRLLAEQASPTSREGEMHRAADGKQELLYPQLVLSSALSLRPIEQTLSTLLLYSLALSIGVWLGAAMLGRWLCRRALSPLTAMAFAARDMHAQDLGRRLPLSDTADELQELGMAFNDLLSRLEEAFARQHGFTAEASHQLRTPLTALLGQVEIALRQERPAAEYRSVLARVERQGQHLARIVEMLLFLSRADADAATLHTEIVELNGWLRQHLASWCAGPRGADLEVRLGDDPVRARVQPLLLGELVDNVLDNACKYSSAGNAITVCLTGQQDRAILTIADFGIGIGQEELTHMFEPFFRSPRARELGVAGSGLGLAIAMRIAKALGGTMRVESQLGVGSTFVVELPLLSRDEEPAREPTLQA